jgi:hypothetical protein
MVPTSHPLGLDIGCDEQIRGIDSVPAGAPEAQEHLVILGADRPADRLNTRSVQADTIKYLAPISGIRTNQAQPAVISNQERVVSVVHEREGTPVLTREPRRPRSRPVWHYLASDA